MRFNKRQTATVLAALRTYQHVEEGAWPRWFGELVDEIVGDPNAGPPLENDEINELCEAINCDPEDDAVELLRDFVNAKGSRELDAVCGDAEEFLAKIDRKDDPAFKRKTAMVVEAAKAARIPVVEMPMPKFDTTDVMGLPVVRPETVDLSKERSTSAFKLLAEAVAQWGTVVDDEDESINGADAVDWLVEFISDAQSIVRRPGFKGFLKIEE